MVDTGSTGASSAVGDDSAGTSSIGGAGMSSIVDRGMAGASSLVELSCDDPVSGRSEKVATGVAVKCVNA